MYLFIALSNPFYLSDGKYFLKNELLEHVKLVFDEYEKLNYTPIESCIGFLKQKEYADKNCYMLKVKKVKADESLLDIRFEVEKELNITNQSINKSLYAFACKSDWIKKNGSKFCPLVCIVDKNTFDIIRKGTSSIRKTASFNAIVDELKNKNDWLGICKMYEPLEQIHKKDVWNNAADLYDIAFACSKLGEPKNGLERNKEHLSFIKRYRDLSLRYYKRCYELKPDDFRYPSAVAYRYYQNVMELTKPKGRRDGKVSEEISNALKWIDIALNLNPSYIKDNYRKGKLILDKQIQNFRHSQKEWTRETFATIADMEKVAVNCLEKCVCEYEKIDSEYYRKRYLNEYIKALYSLGCFFLNKVNVYWNEYACSRLLKTCFYKKMSRDELNYITKAKKMFEKCFEAEAGVRPDVNVDVKQLAHLSKEWAISSIDKMYRLGLVYLHMFFIKQFIYKDEKTGFTYGNKAKAYLETAKSIGNEYKKSGLSRRNTAFIEEKLAWYYIFIEDYNKAIVLTEGSKDGYIRNTYSIAMMLSNVSDKFKKAEIALKEADKNNKAVSAFLLACLYKLSGQADKYNKLISEQKDKSNSFRKRFIPLLEDGDLNENR